MEGSSREFGDGIEIKRWTHIVFVVGHGCGIGGAGYGRLRKCRVVGDVVR